MVRQERWQSPADRLTLVSDLQVAQTMILLVHAANAPHVHPDQLAVAFVISALIVGGSWMMQRRRS